MSKIIARIRREEQRLEDEKRMMNERLAEEKTHKVKEGYLHDCIRSTNTYMFREQQKIITRDIKKRMKQKIETAIRINTLGETHCDIFEKVFEFILSLPSEIMICGRFHKKDIYIKKDGDFAQMMFPHQIFSSKNGKKIGNYYEIKNKLGKAVCFYEFYCESKEIYGTIYKYCEELGLVYDKEDIFVGEFNKITNTICLDEVYKQNHPELNNLIVSNKRKYEEQPQDEIEKIGEYSILKREMLWLQSETAEKYKL